MTSWSVPGMGSSRSSLVLILFALVIFNGHTVVHGLPNVNYIQANTLSKSSSSISSNSSTISSTHSSSSSSSSPASIPPKLDGNAKFAAVNNPPVTPTTPTTTTPSSTKPTSSSSSSSRFASPPPNVAGAADGVDRFNVQQPGTTTPSTPTTHSTSPSFTTSSQTTSAKDTTPGKDLTPENKAEVPANQPPNNKPSSSSLTAPSNSTLNGPNLHLGQDDLEIQKGKVPGGPTSTRPSTNSATATPIPKPGQKADLPGNLRNGSDDKFAQFNLAPSAGLGPNGKAFLANPTAGKPFAVDLAEAPKITKIPPPVSFDNGQPVYGMNATLPDGVDSGFVNLRWGHGTCTLGPGPNSFNAKSCSCINRIGDWYNKYATATLTNQQCQSTLNYQVAADAQATGCSEVTTTKLASDYVAPDGCCDKCELTGSRVRLVYWPPAGKGLAVASNEEEKPANGTGNSTAPAKDKRQEGAIYGTVSDGFTYISPSVYVVYQTLAAHASCVAYDYSSVPIGSTITQTIRGYNPGDLSSAKCMATNAQAGVNYCVGPVGDMQPSDCFQGLDTGWAAIDYAGLYDPPPAAEILKQKQACFTNRQIDAGFAQMMYMSPQLSFPPDVTNFEPIWKSYAGGTCTPIELGAVDPPHALGAATLLVPGGGSAPNTDPGQFGPTMVPAAPAGAGPGQPAPTTPPAGTDEGGHALLPDPLAPASAMVPAPVPVGTNDNLNGGVQPPVNNPPQEAPAEQPAPPPANPPAQPPTEQPAEQPASPPAQPPPPTNNNNDNINFNNVTPQQMSNLDSALSTNPQPQPAPQPAPEQAPPQTPTGNTTPGGTPTEDSASPDPQSVPIVLTPQAPTNDNTAAPPQQGAPAPLAPQQEPPVQNAPAPAMVGGTPGEQGEPAPAPAAPGQPAVAGQPAAGQPAAQPAPAPQFVNAPPQINGQPVQPQANGDLVVGGTTIPAGQTASVDGHQVVNAPNNVVIDGTPNAVAPAPAGPAANPAAAGPIQNNQIVQVSNGGISIAPGAVITPGAAPTTVNGHTYNYVNSGQVIVDGTTNALSPVSTSNPLVIDSQTLSRAAAGGLVIAGSTLAPGASPVTVSGITYAVASGGGAIVANGQTYALPPTENAFLVQALPTGTASSPSPVTLQNGMVITPAPSTNSTTAQVITLPNGFKVTAGGSAFTDSSGTTYSVIAPSATAGAGSSSGGGGGGSLVVVANGTTTTLAIPAPTGLTPSNGTASTTATATGGYGPAIMSGLGNGAGGTAQTYTPPAPSAPGKPATGAAIRNIVPAMWLASMLIGGIMVIL